MIYSKHRFTLDMQVQHSQIAIPVTVGDTGKVFLINLSDGGVPYKIPDGSLAMLTIHRPTGTHLQAFCPIESDSTIVYDFMQNENTAVVEGIHDCELTLYGHVSGSVVSTAWFTMVVSARVVNDDSLNITDENRSAIDAMIDAEASRQSAELARINAESGRVDAENSRAVAEQARQSYYEEFMSRVDSGEFGGGTSGGGTGGTGGGSIIGAKTITLSASGWDGTSTPGKYYYKVTFPGVTSDTAKTHVFSSFVPIKEMESEAARCWVRLIGQGDGFIVYEAQNGIKPSISISVNVIVMG
jgi:hypothetical protein